MLSQISSLTYELSILTKAVHHKNLSAAAVHVGISQPQLSRLLGKLESELKVVLLDRSARRKSGWTPMAHEIALAFTKGMGRLETDISTLTQDRIPQDLRIGTLEGLSGLAVQFSQAAFKSLSLKTIHLDILDFRDLDSQFMSGNLDLIFTVKPPGQNKHQNILEVGYQQAEKISSDKTTLVLSPFEYTALDKKSAQTFEHTLICNSLAVRENWLRNIGGTGNLPKDTRKGRGKGIYNIFLVGNQLLPNKIWTQIENLDY